MFTSGIFSGRSRAATPSRSSPSWHRCWFRALESPIEIHRVLIGQNFSPTSSLGLTVTCLTVFFWSLSDSLYALVSTEAWVTLAAVADEANVSLFTFCVDHFERKQKISPIYFFTSIEEKLKTLQVFFQWQLVSLRGNSCLLLLLLGGKLLLLVYFTPLRCFPSSGELHSDQILNCRHSTLALSLCGWWWRREGRVRVRGAMSAR